MESSSSGETSSPMFSLEIWWFWQKKQWLEQPVKKIVPEPRVPEKEGSSPKCGPDEDMRQTAVSPQKPRAPPTRSTPQSRGQSRHS